MTHSKTLQDRLAQSLDKANKKEKASAKVATVAAPLAKRHCTKLSISLFDQDMTRLNDICLYLSQHGQRIGTSQAIKLALRTAPLTSDLLEIIHSLKQVRC